MVTAENLLRKTPLSYDARNPYAEKKRTDKRKMSPAERVKFLQRHLVK